MKINNKKVYKNIFLSVIIILSAVLCFVTDKELYYYAENKFPHTKILGYAEVTNMHSISNIFPDCVDLRDDGLPIIAKDCILRGYSAIKVDSIISYGFNDSIIVTRFLSTEGEEYYDVIKPFTYNPVIILSDTITETNPVKKFALTKWIITPHCAPYKLLKIRNWSMFIFFLMLVLGFRQIIMCFYVCNTSSKEKLQKIDNSK
ncbi:MAG: hypothetical protein IKJ67_09395 [Bacteroidales bacterium]|nr:hypothetical protein [Bacteroidales bacterium]